MSNTVNKVILVGRLGKDPEIRYTEGGTAVASFSVATDESYKKDGEKVSKTEWHRVVSWLAVDNFIKPYLHKGDMVYIEGKNQTRSWEDKKGGGTRYTTEINVTDIKSLMSKNSDAQPAAKATQNKTASKQPPAQEISDEDIPF